MGSPSGPVFAAIFKVELETLIAPALGNMVLNWKRFADDLIGYVKNGRMDLISKLHSFNTNLHLTSEENRLLFLDVLLIRNRGNRKRPVAGNGLRTLIALFGCPKNIF